MCLSDVLKSLIAGGVRTNESAIRWAIKTGKVSRPDLDGSLRFDFRDENIAELAEHFRRREASHA